VIWKVYSFAFSCFISYLEVSDVKSFNILKLIKFPAVITKNGKSHEFTAVNNDLNHSI